MNEPLVTVLMPVYNGGDYLHQAIDSILNQSYKNIEFLIINDGSTDSGVQVIENYKDNRIRLINNEDNKGLVYSLNLGLKEAKGEYIARMDADDISLQDRLLKQIDFLAKNPEIGICGTSIKVFGEGRREVSFKYPRTHEECRVRLLSNTCFAHPTVVFRKSVIEENGIKYKSEFFPAEDFELWAVNAGRIKYANIPEALYEYRVHRKQISSAKLESQKKLKFGIQLYSLRKVMSELTDEEEMLYEKISFHHFAYTIDFLEKCEALFIRILNANKERNVFDQVFLEKEIQDKWFGICTDFSSNKVNTLQRFRSSPLVKSPVLNWDYFKFLAKNFLIFIKFIR
jgi:glycosyltransferase involved in cell wall biosynthesis